jgi:serine/threonine-protein kinase
MSPEQAKGQAADKRSDVWAFGCILYEMLTGRRAFDGEAIAETLAAVLKSDPDWSLLPASLPPPVRALLEGCLKRDRRDRVGDISTAKFLIDPRSMPQTRASGPAPPASSRWKAAALLAGGIALGGLAVAALRPAAAAPPAPQILRFAFPLPPGQPPNAIRQSIAISPDGTTVAYVADDRLYLRRLSELESHAIAGTEQANSPVFSPDSRSLAFWAHAAINRMDVGGGGAVPIYRTSVFPSGLSWDERGILFAQTGTGILRVSPDGQREAEVLVPLDVADGLAQGPRLLPEGKTLLFTLTSDTAVGSTAERWNNARIVVQSLETGRRTTIVEPGTDARYVPTGHVVYALGSTLFARSFSLATLETTGGPFLVAEPVGRVQAVESGAAEFAFSNTGSLVYVPGQPGATSQQLFLFDREGNGKPLKLPAGLYSYPRVSPDGRYVAFQSTDGRGESYIGICDIDGANARQITLERNSRFPVWSRDSRSIVFQSEGEGGAGIYRQPIDGGVAEQLTKPRPGETHVPEAWSPKEDVLLFNISGRQTTSLWRLSISDRTPTPFGGVTSSRLPTDASFSPDGRWVAYQAGEQGLGEGSVYVMPSQPDNRKYRIAAGGRPVWSRDGKELFYLPGPGELSSVRFSTQGGFTFSDPVPVRRGFGLSGPLSPRGFDVLADGGFIGFAAPVQAAAPAGRTEVRVVLNWFEELKNHGSK